LEILGYGVKMRKFFNLLFILGLVLQLFVPSDLAEAKKVSLTPEQTQQLQDDVNLLTRKTYASSLFSPDDVQKLLEVRDMLNSIADGNMKDPMYAKLFSDTAYVLSKRDYKDDAIQYYTLVKDKFPDTIYSRKAQTELVNLGVKPAGAEGGNASGDQSQPAQ
jgi:hypothetical protein